MYSDEKLLDILRWGAENETPFFITFKDGKFHVSSVDKQIGTDWPIGELSLGGLGTAVYSALSCIRSGADFHSKHGLMPTTSSGSSKEREIGDREGSGNSRDRAADSRISKESDAEDRFTSSSVWHIPKA